LMTPLSFSSSLIEMVETELASLSLSSVQSTRQRG
jgi:hypothetical protein